MLLCVEAVSEGIMVRTFIESWFALLVTRHGKIYTYAPRCLRRVVTRQID